MPRRSKRQHQPIEAASTVASSKKARTEGQALDDALSHILAGAYLEELTTALAKLITVIECCGER